ncbi:pentatricopeptide repeat-containing protein At3g54980, mitochondrial [Phoenix dactylifera]|uniref:Pentatricopeptide repeat-containing protein At3g54980, mitochondrial n=1 Tax=Phoenix dactylifera TaxID=42345 RepID=A0A8B7BT44_PHODC|nr:pentatricopeptide repeat-containing protein At3g54980, mitochondrial [Phoenix dactylifera]
MRALLVSHLRRNPRLLLVRFPSLSPPPSSPPLTPPPIRSLHGLPSPPQSDSFSSPPSRILQSTTPVASELEEEDAAMNEFLSRFVWAIRGKLVEAYPTLAKETLDAMLLVICQKVVAEMEKAGDGAAAADSPIDLSEDLWKTIWEVSNSVHEAIRRDRMREELKKYLHSDEVKDMCHFAAEIGIRGPMLRELRFKWAREKLEEVEFYRSLDQMREQAKKQEEEEEASSSGSGVDPESNRVEAEKGGRTKVLALPLRKGKIKYKIYGLDLSDPKWAEVAERVEEAEKHIVPEEPQPVEGKCKKVEEKLLALKAKRDDPTPVLAEWAELLQPKKVDWLALLDRIKERNVDLYFKVAEHLLTEESFDANIRDYSKLIDAHAKADRIEDAERILQKMTERGIKPDVLTSIILVHMYSRAGNLDRAKEAFESLRKEGFQPDLKVYSSMITAYVKAGIPKQGEALVREMESRDIKPTKEIYMELLQAFGERGQVDGAQRIMNTMQFAGIQPTLESFTLLIESYGQAGDPDQARGHFDHMMKAGHKPDDRCTASMMAAYVKKNLLDKALDLLLTLERDGFRPGIATYAVLVDWLGRLQLVEEAERLLNKITQMGEAPFEIHVSLCDMYSRAQQGEKVRKSLKILEARKKLLRADQFERIVSGLLAGGFVEDAKRINNAMEARGFTPSEPTRVALMAAQSIPRQKSPRRGGKV